MRVGPALAALVVGFGVLPLTSMPAAHAEVEDYPCSGVRTDSRPIAEAESPSQPFGLLNVQAAWDRLARQGFAAPGAGVGVAVVDSGVVASPRLRVRKAFSNSASSVVSDYHGTAVAGLIAAASRPGAAGGDPKPVGFAPAAQIFDVKFYDTAAPTDETAVGPETQRLKDALLWVANNAKRLGIKVANVSVAVPEVDGALTRAVNAVLAADVVLVAASGNRPLDEGAPFSTKFGSQPRPGEDAARDIFPAGAAPGVLVVNATAEGSQTAEAADAVLYNSATDVAAPTYGAVSASLSGGSCVLLDVSSEWAAAQVSGLVALVRQRYPAENAKQIVARVVRSASGVAGDGSPHVRNPLTGAGVIQPVEALTRELRPRRDGKSNELAAAGNDNPRAKAPAVRPDVLAPSRRHAIWIGLVGGGAILMAALARPLVAMLRRTR